MLVDQPERVDRLRANASLFRRLAAEAGINSGSGTAAAVVPVITGDSARALRLAHAMRGHGVNVAPIIHPAVHEDDARLRFFVNATHTADQIHTTIDALRAELDHLAR